MKSLPLKLSFKKVNFDNKEDIYQGIALYLSLVAKAYHFINPAMLNLDQIVSNFMESAAKVAAKVYVIIVDKEEVGWLYYYIEANTLTIKNLYLDPKCQGIQLGSSIVIALAQTYNLPIRMDVLAINHKANKFFKALGGYLATTNICFIEKQKLIVNNYLLDKMDHIAQYRKTINPALLTDIKTILNDLDRKHL